jgi:hypothetical protein
VPDDGGFGAGLAQGAGGVALAVGAGEKHDGRLHGALLKITAYSQEAGDFLEKNMLLKQ